MSKALPVFRPHTTSAPLATYHFCMRSIVPVLRLKFEVFRLSLLAFVSQVPVSIRLFLEIYRWPRGFVLSRSSEYSTLLFHGPQCRS